MAPRKAARLRPGAAGRPARPCSCPEPNSHRQAAQRGAAHPLLSRQSPPRERSRLTVFPLAGSLPGFYLTIPSKSLSKQYRFLTFFCSKVNSQHISNSRALLFFRGGCRSALCSLAAPIQRWVGVRGISPFPLGEKNSKNEARPHRAPSHSAPTPRASARHLCAVPPAPPSRCPEPGKRRERGA